MYPQTLNPNKTGFENDIFSQIRRESQDFLYSYIAPVPGYSFNQYMMIKKCYLYLQNRYETDSSFLGRRRLFFDIITPPCEVAEKMLNVDTKNIKLIPVNDPKNYFPVYLLEKELKVWLKRSKMGKVLNQIASEAPRYGSVVLEKTKKGAEVVDLRRLFLDPSVDYIKDSRFITTVHYMSETQLRETDWENVEQAIDLFKNSQAPDSFEDKSGNLNLIMSSPLIKVYKRYGEVPKSWLDGGSDDKPVKALYIVAGPDYLNKNSEGKVVGELGVVLFKSEWNKEYPFKDFHYNKVKGRWLGKGVVESLVDVQVRVNEIKNQKRVSMEVSTVHLFQTKDKTITRNILTDLQSGDLVYSQNGIEPIVNEERNLSAFDSEETSYLNQADKLTFAYEAVRGEQPTATTPLGTTQIAVAQASSVYGFKRQNLDLMYQEFFNDFVMPQLLKDLTPEHIMRFTGTTQEIEKLDEAAANIYANEVIIKAAIGGERITPELQEQAKKKAFDEYRKLGSNRYLKLKENFYGNVEYEFDFNIDNEQIDPQTIVQNIQAIIPFFENPAILQDPRAKVVFNKLSQQLGISPAELELAEGQATQLEQSGELPINQLQNGAIPETNGELRGGQQLNNPSGIPRSVGKVPAQSR
jgi:hypothetical protein